MIQGPVASFPADDHGSPHVQQETRKIKEYSLVCPVLALHLYNVRRCQVDATSVGDLLDIVGAVLDAVGVAIGAGDSGWRHICRWFVG